LEKLKLNDIYRISDVKFAIKIGMSGSDINCILSANGPVLSSLIQVLSPLEIIQLRELYPQFKEITDKKPYDYNKSVPADNKLALNFASVVKRRLSELIPDVDNFWKVLVESQVVISGSFILQCLYGEYYENSDIDVYHLGGNKDNHMSLIPLNGNKMERYLFENYIPSKNINNYINQIVNQKLYYPPPGMYDGKYDTKIVAMLHRAPEEVKNKTSERKYRGVINNIIITNDFISETENKFRYDSAFQYIKEVFDFSICKVGFQPSTNKLYISDMKGLILKTGTYRTNSILTSREKKSDATYNRAKLKAILDNRIERYIKRGFTLVDLDPLDASDEAFVSR
jgi:hypothetical protein